MIKMFVLLLIMLLTLASLGSYLFLSEKIIDGEKQIANGQKQIEEGQRELEEGRVELKAGKLESTAGREKYEQAEENLFMVLADDLFNRGKGYKAGRERVAAGNVQVATGVDNVNDGARRLEAGKQKLLRGKRRLGIVKGARIVCGLATVFFAIVTIMLGFCWRRSLGRIFMRTEA